MTDVAVFNLASLVEASARRGVDRVAFHHYESGRAVTHGDVLAGVNRTGNALRSRGVEIEHRVAILLDDSVEFVYALYGSLKLGAIAVPMNTLLRAADYAFMLDDCRARVLFAGPAVLPRVRQVRRGLRHLRHVVVCGGVEPQDDEVTFEDLVAGAPDVLETEPTSCNDIATFRYTSGSTGRPRAIMLRHGRGLPAGLGWGLGEGDVQFHVPKLYFGTSQGGLQQVFNIGAPMVLLSGRVTAENVLDVIARYRPVFLAGPPTIFARMVEAARQGASADLSCLRYVFCAGEALPAELYRRFRDTFGKELSNRWGAQEGIGAPLGFAHGETTPPDKVGSVGRLVGDAEVRIVDEQSTDVPDGVSGQLLVKTPGMFVGYWHEPEEAARRMFGGWFKPGDFFVRDHDGYYWYLGRADDMVKVGGRQVFPAEVEAALARHPGVLECAVVDVRNPEGLAELVAFVVLEDGHQASPELASELRDFVKGQVAPYKRPHRVQFVGELTRTETGKVQRFRLRELAATMERSQPGGGLE